LDSSEGQDVRIVPMTIEEINHDINQINNSEPDSAIVSGDKTADVASAGNTNAQTIEITGPKELLAPVPETENVVSKE